jgi:guanine deaminase
VIVDVKTREIVGEGYNQVVGQNDATWHGEVAAIRDAGKRLGRPHLTGTELFTSAEPCPMCACACLWAHIDRVHYGALYGDVMEHGGFLDADFASELSRPNGERTLMPLEPLLREEAVDVWREFAKIPDSERPQY